MSDTVVFVGTFGLCILLGLFTQIAKDRDRARARKKRKRVSPPKKEMADQYPELKPFIANGYTIESFDPLIMSRKDSYNGTE